jgi:hypothetical protein
LWVSGCCAARQQEKNREHQASSEKTPKEIERSSAPISTEKKNSIPLHPRMVSGGVCFFALHLTGIAPENKAQNKNPGFACCASNALLDHAIYRGEGKADWPSES